MKIGIANENIYRLKGGPKVFMARMSGVLRKKGLLSDEECDVFLGLSFKKLPPLQTECKIILRCDGIWRYKFWPFNFTNTIENKLITLNTHFLKMQNRIYLENLKQAQGLIFQSDYSRRSILQIVKKLPITQKNIVIYNGVDTDVFSPHDVTGPDVLRIVVSHRFTFAKRFLQIISVANELKDHGLKFEIHVLGGGVLNHVMRHNTLEFFKKCVAESRVSDCFIFHGHIDPNELPSFYNKCNMMLNLAYADPCPNVVIEALACGLPVVAPDHGGIKELIVGQGTGIHEGIDDLAPSFYGIYSLQPKINANVYAEKIIEVWSDIKSYRQNARDHALKCFNIDNTVAEYTKFMTEC